MLGLVVDQCGLRFTLYSILRMGEENILELNS